MMIRDESLARLRDAAEPFDVLIVGGGATGLGAAVDASGRGYRVALVEQADFAAGTSSCSTKLVHGGVRYLRQGNISLVRSALRERALLLKNAPHLASSLRFVIPCYSYWEILYYRFGLGLYDRLSGSLSLGRSRVLTREETIECLPTIETARLCGGVVYYDGQFDDSRLAMTLAQTASEQGACLINYCRCIGLLKEAGRVSGVLLRDLEGGTEFGVRAKAVVNATGIFVDTMRSFEEPSSKSLVSASQGVHLVLPRRFLPGGAALMIPRTEDGRVLFAIPWKDRVVVGTTDTAGVLPTMTPRAQEAEIEFLLTHLGKYLAHAPVESDVLSLFAGLRPLVAQDGESTASLSRAHTIMVSKGKLLTVTGGKWTTYRKMAEEVIDTVEKIAGLPHRRCPTENLALHGPIPVSRIADPLLKVYGSDAGRILEIAEYNEEGEELLHRDLPYIKAEVIWHVRYEMARTVEDVLARRTRALVLDAGAAIASAQTVAGIIAKELQRDSGWIEQQVRQFNTYAANWLMPKRFAPELIER